MKRNRPTVPLLRFLGATGTVTGSRFLLETPRARVLIDCGLYQGLKPLRLRNWSPFPGGPGEHRRRRADARASRSLGYLPALAHNGFRGSVFATAGTQALAGIVLPDSAPHPGKRMRAMQSQGLLQAHPGVAALHHGRRRARARAVPGRAVLSGERDRARGASDLPSRGPHSRLGDVLAHIDGDGRRPAHRALQRRSRAPAASDPGAAHRSSRRRRDPGRVDVRRS